MSRTTGSFRALARGEPRGGGVRLYGVTDVEGWDGHPLAESTRIVRFRDLGAITAAAPFSSHRVSEKEAHEHRQIVEAIFAQRPVLPAPVGTVFRSEEALVRWLELHFVTLSDGLVFTEGRVGMRVHVFPRTPLPDGEVAADLSSAGPEVFRALREHAVTYSTLRTPREESRVSAAFLVERERSRVFEEAVEAEGERRPSLVVEHTGPWPPYDFVKMQFGA